MQVGLLGDLDPQRVDDDQPPPLALRGPDVAHDMQVRDGRTGEFVCFNDNRYGRDCRNENEHRYR